MLLADILSSDRVRIGLDLASKKAVLEELSRLLATANPALAANSVFDSLLARERLGTTGLGGGIAIPHGRADTGGASIGAFLRTRKPINFDAVDNAPVDLFFALCVPKEANEEHLQLLAALAEKFSNANVIDRLRAAEQESTVFKELVELRPGGG